MAYSKGRRPFEYASKSSHSYIISDPTVQDFLQKCKLPTQTSDVELAGHCIIDHDASSLGSIEHIIAIDGGYREIVVQPQFPSSMVAFIQCGALSFGLADLHAIDKQPFISPEDMAKLKNIERLKLALPVKSVRLSKEASFVSSVRKTIFEFFLQSVGGSTLADSLAWLIFEEFKAPAQDWRLASCPSCSEKNIQLKRSALTEFKLECSACGGEIFITDVMRLHEAIDEELGAGGILGYLVTTIEQIILIHMVKTFLSLKPDVLSRVIFIKDGPLAFFGQTANLHKPMRSLVRYLFDKHVFFAAGLEKSGAFVEHAQQIAPLMKPSQILILDNEYIYKYIIPGSADPSSPYGRTTYYGTKVIYKSASSGMHVVTLPTVDALANPVEADLKNLHLTLNVVDRLRCDMYDNALIPIALANKLVSLADHPSTKILERFAKSAIPV